MPKKEERFDVEVLGMQGVTLVNIITDQETGGKPFIRK